MLCLVYLLGVCFCESLVGDSNSRSAPMILDWPANALSAGLNVERVFFLELEGSKNGTDNHLLLLVLEAAIVLQ